MCPVREYIIKTKHQEWLTPEIIEIQKDRDYFFNKAKNSNTDGDSFVARNLRHIANKAVRAAKAEFVKAELHRNKSNPNKFWRYIKTHVLPNSPSGNINLTNSDGSKLNKQQTADTINDYFANIGLNLASNIPQGPTTLCRVTQPPADIFNLQPVTEDQVKKQLKMLATHKSSGLTELSTTFIKDSLMILSK